MAQANNAGSDSRREQPRLRVVVVGGGISGLATAFFLQRSGADVTLLEAGPHLGGKIRTEKIAGMAVDGGADGFIASETAAARLCADLGLSASLVAPTTARASIWSRGRLRPIPGGLVRGMPARLWPVAASGLLSLHGMARAGLEPLLPRTRLLGEDVAIGDYVQQRFGSEVVDRLVEPLLGGIYAGRAHELSLQSVAPELHGVARKHRSLMLGARSLRHAGVPAAPPPSLVTLEGGLTRLVRRLVAAMEGADVRTASPVTSIEPAGNGWAVSSSSGALRADAVVLAAPAFETARLLARSSPLAAAELDQIGYVSVATVLLAYPRTSLASDRTSSGFLVPRGEARTITACTFLSDKWRHLHSADAILMRCAVGRRGQQEALRLDDSELVARVVEDLGDIVGIKGLPGETRVVRWNRAIPQYVVGHQRRVSNIEAALPPGLVLAGAGYRGVGVASCIAQAERAAAMVLGRTAAAWPVAEVAGGVP